uniref:Uncharacterized protein n=1 Tax=Arundo donax TaxID=35708 RepID=A0A0A9BBG1_ARUDO
MAVALDGPT